MVKAHQAWAVALLGLVSTAIVPIAIHSDLFRSRRFDKPATPKPYANLPVNFIENAGQTDSWVRFYAQGADFGFYLTPQEAVFRFAAQSASRTNGGAFDRTFNIDTCLRCGIDQYDAFVFKLNAAGSSLVYSTFPGGFDIDDGLAITVDTAGSPSVAGETGSANFPTTSGAIFRARSGAYDAFLTKLNHSGVWNGDPPIFWADAFVAKLTPIDGPGTTPVFCLATVTPNPSTVTGGSGSTGTVAVNATAP